MTTETLLALLVSYVGNPVSMWLAINRKPFGWVIVFLTQALFVTFAATSGDWRFGGQAICLLMGAYGMWKWYIRRSHEPAIGKAAEQQAATVQQLLTPPTQVRRDIPGITAEQWTDAVLAVQAAGRRGSSTTSPQPVDGESPRDV